VIEATLPGYNTATWEDPEIWKSGKKYYCSVNNYASKKAIYMTSDDGITNWKYGGAAYSPLNQNMLRYTNGRKNSWFKMECPGVYVENGILKFLMWAVIDTEKETDKGNDNHNNKIIVIPFNGAAFDGITAVQAGEMRNDSKPWISLIVDNSGKAKIIIPSGALSGTAHFDAEVYNVNGRLVARMSNVMINGGGFALNHKNPGSRLSSGAYWVGLRYGKRQLQGRFTIP
jgi:hypothetical protein